jgi:hypothetical protein
VEKSLIFACVNLLCIFVAKQQRLRIEAVVGGDFLLNTNKGF